MITNTCRKGVRDLQNMTNKQLDKQVDCDTFESKYIEYPLTVNEVKKPLDTGIRTDSVFSKCGQLVKVRPCKDGYKNKTYLGILLGEADIGLFISHNQNSNELNINRHYNPAIFVPELKEIMYGYESWWSEISSEDELKEISDDDIENVWYVRMLKNKK